MNRFAVFLTVVLGIWSAMHAYVFWRLATIPWVVSFATRRGVIALALLLWLTYPMGRILQSYHWKISGQFLEFVGAYWVGVLFLLFSAFLVVDLVTGGGFLLPKYAIKARAGGAVLAGLLAIMAILQGLRPPVVRDYEVVLPNLPRERDGLILVQISDLHLGTMTGKGRLEDIIRRVQGLNPDMVVVVGDLVDSNVEAAQSFIPVLQHLRAPLGVWAVTGNHEYYAGLERSIELFRKAGFSVLQDDIAEPVPGLSLAGVDDLTSRGEYGAKDGVVSRVLARRRPGATILLSHSPLEVAEAAKAGAGLMLSGHTHNGQIWPFNYLVRLRYQFIGGPYKAGPMRLLVCRGTGTWGPRMRLWYPSEMLRIKLRSPEAVQH